MNRRTALKAGIVLALTSHKPAVAAPAAKPSIDEILARSTPAEIARYHSNALMEVMQAMHPHLHWRSTIDHEYQFAIIFGHQGENQE